MCSHDRKSRFAQGLLEEFFFLELYSISFAMMNFTKTGNFLMIYVSAIPLTFQVEIPNQLNLCMLDS
jgi:hypothetical protein